MTQHESVGQDAARQEFSALAAHALRGAAHSFTTALELLANEKAVGSLNQQQRKLLRTATSGAAQLRQLGDDMALLTYAAAGGLAPHFTPITVTTLIRKAVELAQQPEAPSPARDIAIHITPALPALPGDVALLSRALAAIIENALRFSPAESTITVEARKRRDRITFTVSDDGPGVPADQSASIFEPLSTLAHPQNIVGIGLGLGVGLAVARAVVEAHGGRITFSRAASGGAAFTVALPVNEASGNASSR